jgi:hypothetical protein
MSGDFKPHVPDRVGDVGDDTMEAFPAFRKPADDGTVTVSIPICGLAACGFVILRTRIEGSDQ